MPQRTQHCLVHVLLLWITVLSIMQVVFIIFYFTVGRQRTTQIQPNNMPSFPPDPDHLLGKAKMLTFQAAEIYDKAVKWSVKKPDLKLVSDGEVLTIKNDGYYFLNLQVTLYSCSTPYTEEYTVTLKWNNDTLLQGFINTKLCSTGLLGKVEELSAGGNLDVTINPKPKQGINTSESATHLDIIYMTY